MTARQAGKSGLGKLWIDLACNRVYNLCLNQGGNILVETTAQLQHTSTYLEAATMGYCLESPSSTQPKGSPTYPQSYLTKLAGIQGMETGQKNFGLNELKTEPNGGICFRQNRDREEAWRTQKGKQQETIPESTFEALTYGTEMKQRVNPPGPANLLPATTCPSDVIQTPSRKVVKPTGEYLGPLTAEPSDNVSESQQESPQEIDHNSQETFQDQAVVMPQDTKLVKQSQDPQSLETKPQVTHPWPKATTRLDTQLSPPAEATSKLDVDGEVECNCLTATSGNYGPT